MPDTDSPRTENAVQVVNSGPSLFTIDLNALKSILLEDLKDMPLAVISVAGLSRMGKSFLLNLMINHLQHGDEFWDSAGTGEMKGFPWRGGMRPTTSGIMLWSKPFVLTNRQGRKVACLLMDTEGTFDINATLKQNATVFALSTLLSSVQVYNLADNILEDGLQYLQYFTEYGRLALEKDSLHKPFQRLVFLVRDWSNPDDYPYGDEGGSRLLDSRMRYEKSATNNHRSESLHSALRIRQHISSCFERIDCFLLPHPGQRVAASASFNGSLGDVDPEFVDQARQFVSGLCDADSLIVKMIDGQPVTGSMLYGLFETYGRIFTSDQLPKPALAYRMTAIAHNEHLLDVCKHDYRQMMEDRVGRQSPYVNSEVLMSVHELFLQCCMDKFERSHKMGDADLVQEYREQLNTGLSRLLSSFIDNNQRKNVPTTQSGLVLLSAGVVLYVVSNFFALIGLSSLSNFLFAACVALLGLLGVWAYGALQADEPGSPWYAWSMRIEVIVRPIWQQLLINLTSSLVGSQAAAQMVKKIN